MSAEPRTIGKYELRELLERSSVAEVWKGFDTQLRRYVVVKLLHADLQNDPDFLQRFVREARLVASLHHPNIVQIHDFQVSRPPESDQTVAYMVMDFVEGESLARYIQDTSGQGTFPTAADIVHLFTSISSAVDYAHQCGMIHRDIKPGSILLDKRQTTRNRIGEPILTDFGIARLLGASVSALSGTWQGEVPYIAPEQIKGQPASELSDIYSLGVILYEICTGTLPFGGENPTEIMMQKVNSEPQAPELRNPQVHPALSIVIMRALSNEPKRRFPSAAALTAALAGAFNVPVPENLGQPASLADSTHSPSSLSPLHPDVQMRSTLSTPSAPLPVATMQTKALTPSPATSSDRQSQPYSVSGVSTVISPLTPVSPLQPAPALAPPPARRRKRRGLLILSGVLLAFILAGAVLGAFYLFAQKPPPVITTASGGHAFFVSSGLLSEDNSQGIDDLFQISLQNIPPPAPGKSYYAWLLADRIKNPTQYTCKPQQEVVSLGRLPVKNGQVNYLYPGDKQHTNLFGCTSLFLITQENARSTPLQPSTDKATWRYYAELPQIPDPHDALKHMSIVDQMRELLYEGTTIGLFGLHGGVDIRALRTGQKVWEWVTSARDSWDSRASTSTLDFIHRQLVRTMDYLDGTGTGRVQTELPRERILVDLKLTQFGLIHLPNQSASYLDRLSNHMVKILRAPGITPEIRKLATQILAQVNIVQTWYAKVHQDAKRMVSLSDAQLLQPGVLSTLNHMQTYANYAFAGQIDPATNQEQAGLAEIHYEIQQLATFDVKPYSS